MQPPYFVGAVHIKYVSRTLCRMKIRYGCAAPLARFDVAAEILRGTQLHMAQPAPAFFSAAFTYSAVGYRILI